MKKTLSTIFAMAVIVTVFATAGFSQSVTLQWNMPTMENGAGVPLGNNCAIMVVYQDNTAPNPEPISVATPHLLTGNDKIVPFLGMFAGFNPLPYNTMFPTGFADVTLNTAAMNLEEGDTFKMYVRVFDNISASAFTPDGTWDGTFIDGGTSSNYYQSESRMVLAKADTENRVEFVLSTQTQTIHNLFPDTHQFPAGEPVPEPSAMFLAAIGVAWLGRRIKKV